MVLIVSRPIGSCLQALEVIFKGSQGVQITNDWMPLNIVSTGEELLTRRGFKISMSEDYFSETRRFDHTAAEGQNNYDTPPRIS